MKNVSFHNYFLYILICISKLFKMHVSFKMAVQILYMSLCFFIMIKIATINVQGMQDAKKREYIYQNILQNKYDITALQEVHCTQQQTFEWEKEWKGVSIWNNGSSMSCGVALLFRPDTKFELTNIDKDFNGRVISVTVTKDEQSFQILNLYGHNPEIKNLSNEFFEDITQYLQPNKQTIMCGDFNMVEDISLDRRGGHPREKHTWGNEALQEIKGELNLVDIWRHLNPKINQFTWHSYYADISSRLDRIYIASSLITLVETVDIVPFSWSDHDAVVITFSLPEKTTRGPGYWKLNTKLLQDENYVTQITEFWKEWQKKKPTYEKFSMWWDIGKIKIKDITITFATERNKIKKQQRQELVQQLTSERSKTQRDMTKISDIREQIKEYDLQEAERIYIATHMEKLENDEKPSKYFFNMLKAKENKNTLSHIYVKDEQGKTTVSSNIDDILQESTVFYQNLYRADTGIEQEGQNELLNLVDKHLSEQEKDSLDNDLSKKEIREALFATENNKTPGWDGIPYDFYKTFWGIMEDDFYELQNYILNIDKSLSNTQQRALINLLYKDGDKKDISNWRPISLLCSDYKVISKAIANKMKKILSSVVHADQTCSVPGRSIFSNLFLVRDIIRYTNEKRIKGYILTIDQEKAFDRVDRKLLFKTLQKMNFGEKIIQWLKIIYDKPTAAVYVNGHIAETFETSRGIRQGCPLSAILYTLVAELMGNMIRNNQNIEGIALPGTKEQAKIVQYADDTVFFISARTKIKELFKAISMFEKYTGSIIKTTKTKGLCLGGEKPFSSKTKVTWKDEFGLEILGIFFFADSLMTTNANWRIQGDILKEVIEKAKHRKLSFRGKVINLNCIGLAKFWYTATVIPFPEWEVETFNRIIFPYLWGEGNKNEYISRETMLLPKLKGGLGIFQPEKQSKALGAKFIQQIGDVNNKQKWVYFARYYIGLPISSFDEKWEFLRDIKYPKRDRNIFPEYYGNMLEVFKLVDKKTIKWTTKYFYDLQINKENKKPKAEDKWPRMRNLKYNWEDVWKGTCTSYAPGKYQETHYKFIHLALPTLQLLKKWNHNGNLNPNCKACRADNKEKIESHLHLFFDCDKAFDVWRQVKKIIQKLIPKVKIQCFMFTMNIFPKEVSETMKRLIITLIQLTIHNIWLNRNRFHFEQKKQDVAMSLNYIQKLFRDIIKSIHNKLKREGNLYKFRMEYCESNNLVSLDTHGNIKMAYE